jgi:hypothetical protein
MFFLTIFLVKNVLGWERGGVYTGVKEGGKGTKKNANFFTARAVV